VKPKKESEISRKSKERLRKNLDEDYVEDRISRKEYMRRRRELEDM
jgi:hypothetical protein